MRRTGREVFLLIFFSGHNIRVKKLKLEKKKKVIFGRPCCWWDVHDIARAGAWKKEDLLKDLHEIKFAWYALYAERIYKSFYMNLVRILFFRDSVHLKVSKSVNVRVGFSFGL